MLERLNPEIQDGWYQTGDIESEYIGLTEDLFSGHFTRRGNSIILHHIYSKNPSKGNTQRFLQDCVEDGWDIVIVYPNEAMQHICKKLWLTPAEEIIADYYRGKSVTCWRRRG
jgi:hypothetical protein